MSSAATTPRSNSPDVDFSVIRTAIEMGSKVIDQILNGIHYGSQEVRNLLLEEADFIMECKVCKNLFRSLPNFVAHKRVYCMEGYKEHLEKQDEVADNVSEEAVIVQPEAPENTAEIPTTDQQSSSHSSVMDKVVTRTFAGKSHGYQFYTKVAETVEKKKASKVTSTITLGHISSNENAVTMTMSPVDGASPVPSQDISTTDIQPSLLKQILTKRNSGYDTPTKPSLKKVIENLACKKVFSKTLDNSWQCQDSQTVKARPIRSRKSSPRKSVDSYIGMKEDTQKEPDIKMTSPPEDDSDSDLEEWFKDPSTSRGSNITCINDCVQEREWLEHCDLKKSHCKTCNKRFTSVYALKFHVKVKHSGKEGQYMCPKCGKTFVYFMALARHLRGAHTKSETYIGKLQIKLRGALGRRKSLERTDETPIQSLEANADSDPNTKKSSTLLPYSTGWKKCDKCGKVFWKAKSYKRHYQTCRGPEKEKEGGGENEKDFKSHKADEIQHAVVKAVENARVITHGGNEKEKHNCRTESLASKDMPYGTRLSKAAHVKNIKGKHIRSVTTEIVFENTNKAKDGKQGEMAFPVIDKVSTLPLPETASESDSSPIRIKAAQKGISDEVEKPVISTRSHGSAEIPNVAAVVEELRSSEQIDPCSEKGMKELRKLQIDMVEYETAKIDQCKLKVSPVKAANAKLSVKKGTIPSEDSTECSVVKKKSSDINEAETNKQQHEACDINLKSPEKSIYDSPDTLSVDTSLLDNVNLNVSVEVSPIRIPLDCSRISVGSPTGTSVSSPPAYSISSPSRNSESSYDGSIYGGKMPLRRMSVKEMAEIVESASLVKFARERGNKARRVLNKQQNSNKNSTPKRRKPLSKSLEPAIQRKMYGTRLVSKTEKTADLVADVDENDVHKYETRSSISKLKEHADPETVDNLSSDHTFNTGELNDNVGQLQHGNITHSSVEHGSLQLRHEQLLSSQKEDSAIEMVANSKSKHELEKLKISMKSVSRNVISSDMDIVAQHAEQQQHVVNHDSSCGTRHLRNRKSLNDTKVDSKEQHLYVKRKRNMSESGACKSSNSPTSDNSPSKVPITNRLSRSSERAKSSISAELIGEEGHVIYDSLMDVIKPRQLRSIDKLKTPKEINSTTTTVLVFKNKTLPGSSTGVPHEVITSKLTHGICQTKNNVFPQEAKLNTPDEVENNKQPSRTSISSESKELDDSIIDSLEEVDSTMPRTLRNTRRLSAGMSAKQANEKPFATATVNVKQFPNSNNKCDGNIDKEQSANEPCSPVDKETSRKQHKYNKATSPNPTCSSVSVLSNDDDVSENKDKHTTYESNLSENDAARLVVLIKDISDIQGARYHDQTSSKDNISSNKGKLIVKHSETKLNSDRKTMLAADRMLRGKADKYTSNIFEIVRPGSEYAQDSQLSSTNPTSTHSKLHTENSKTELLSSKSDKGNDSNISEICKDGDKHNSEMSRSMERCISLNEVNEPQNGSSSHVPVNAEKSDKHDKAISETHSHRTRLSTGTIAPLDLSYLDEDPTLSLKSIAALTRPISMKELSDNTNVKSVHSANIISESPNNGVDKPKQPSNHEPHRFSLQTGVIQCEKCHKAFWKKQSYQIHIRSPQCRDPNLIVPKGKHRRRGMMPSKRRRSVSPRKSNTGSTGDSDNHVKTSKNDTDDAQSGVKRCKLDKESSKDENSMISTSSTIPLFIGTAGSSGQAELMTASNIETETASTHSNFIEISLNKSSVVDVSAEIAGPSYINTNNNDSGDDSEFSGFSEADINNSSLERVGLDFEDVDDSQDSPAADPHEHDACASLADISSMSTDESGKETALCVDTSDIDLNVAVGEKTKSNRKYVTDSKKPSRLHCLDQVRVDHLIDMNKHKCLECGLNFTTVSNARRHAVRHLGWKRFKCNICSFSCYNFSECKAHLIRTHSVQDDKNVSISSLIIDLNKEACKRRTVKRMKTIQRKKATETLDTHTKSAGSSAKQLDHKHDNGKHAPTGQIELDKQSSNNVNVVSEVVHKVPSTVSLDKKCMTSQNVGAQLAVESESDCSGKSSTSVDSPVKKSMRLAAKEDTRPSAQEMLKGITLKRPPAPYVQKTSSGVIKTTAVNISDEGKDEGGNIKERDESPAQDLNTEKLNVQESPLARARINLAKALK